MEARRLSILCSHLRPITLSQTQFGLSDCASGSTHELADLKTSNLVEGCVFCKIIRGESHAFKGLIGSLHFDEFNTGKQLYEDDICLCILDTHPLSRGHSLIIPKSHFPSLEATPPSVVAAMCSKVPFISNAIMKATGSDSFNLLVNNGTAAGQVIFHTHVHIIPRKARDCLWTSESLERRPIDSNQEASQLVECVRGQLSDDARYSKVQDRVLEELSKNDSEGESKVQGSSSLAQN